MHSLSFFKNLGIASDSAATSSHVYNLKSIDTPLNKKRSTKKSVLRRKNKSQLSFTSVGRADEAAAVASVYEKCYDGVYGNDALHSGDENEEAVALAAVAATEK
jgi:hypothetical protein